jgi:hypothetical protein
MRWIKLDLTYVYFFKYVIVGLNPHRLFVETESIVWIFFIFWPSNIYVSAIDIVSSLFPPRCHLSSGWRHHAATSCHASFPWSQEELTASASSFGNALSRHLPSRAKIETLNPHHRRRPPSPNSLTPTIHCYKKVILTESNMPTTQLHLYFISSLASALHHWSSIHHHRSLSLLYGVIN